MHDDRMSLSLSDGLVEFSQFLAEFEHASMILHPEDARTLRERLREMRLQARNLENEVSRHRWNDAARRERHDRERADSAVIAELTRPGTNVTLFPVIHRPFSDGHPREIG